MSYSPLICPCCRSPMTLFADGTYREYNCSNCDYVHFASRSGISAEEYENSEKYQDYYTGTPPSLWYHKNALKILSGLPGQKRILDFGCYDGFFVRSMIEAGLDAYGCDWNRAAIAHGKSAFGLENRLSRDPNGTYDVIVALEVIEHFNDPQDFFQTIMPHLTQDGVIILSCPNKNALYRPGTDCPPHHFSRFSQNSLRTIVERHSFKTIEQRAEMSSFQLLRNLVGDRMRQQSAFKEAETSDDAQARLASQKSGGYQALRRAADAGAGAAQALLWPVDAALYAAGQRYLAQLIWARRT